MVNLPRGQKVSGLHGVPSLFQGAILRLVRLNGLSLLPIPFCQAPGVTVSSLITQMGKRKPP